MDKSAKLKEVTYRVGRLIFIYLVSGFSVFAIAYLNPNIRTIYVIILVIWTLYFYLYAQNRYSKIEFHLDKMVRIFPISCYLKNRVYLHSDIDFVFFQFNVGSWVDPFVDIHFKNKQKRKRIRMSKNELQEMLVGFRESGIRIQKARYAYDRP